MGFPLGFALKLLAFSSHFVGGGLLYVSSSSLQYWKLADVCVIDEREKSRFSVSGGHERDSSGFFSSVARDHWSLLCVQVCCVVLFNVSHNPFQGFLFCTVHSLFLALLFNAFTEGIIVGGEEKNKRFLFLFNGDTTKAILKEFGIIRFCTVVIFPYRFWSIRALSSYG